MARDIIVRDVKLADAEAIVGTLNPIIAVRIHTAFDQPFSLDASGKHRARH